MRQIRVLLFGFLIVSCITAYVVWINFVPQVTRANTQPDPNAITIETNHIPILPQHEHGHGDSPDDDGHHTLAYSATYRAPEDFWITGIDWSVENAPATVLHHFALSQLDKASPACPNQQGRSLFTASQDSMYKPYLRFPEGYAQFIKKGTPLVLIVALHNAEPPIGPGGVYSDVSVRIVLHTVPASTGAKFTPVEMRQLYLDEDGCSRVIPAQSFTVPSHSTNYVYRAAESLENNPGKLLITATSTVVYAGGHVHGWQGGKEVIVLKNGQVFDDQVTKKSRTDPYRYETQHFATSTELFPGDILSVEAIYDNPYDVPARGAMGEYILFLTQ